MRLWPTDALLNPSEHEHMPLLRSLADRAERVATNMALLAELFAWQRPLRPAKAACKVLDLDP